MAAQPISYMICSMPRSGGTLLCELLDGTGVLGKPQEFFHPGRMSVFFARRPDATLDDYVEALLRRFSTPNGVFGFKVHYHQMTRALGDRDPGQLFPGLRLVSIRRGDRVRQAVSWARALQTKEWTSEAGGGEAPRFDAEAIERQLHTLEREEALWEEFYREHDAAPLRITYEDLVQELDKASVDVMAFLGVPVPEGFRQKAPTLERQADELSDEWVRRYRALQPRAEGKSPR
jgi:trehalose 2-sulfotransferase